MFYVDNASGIAEMPALKPVYSTSPTWFTEGGGSTPPTYPGPDTYNMIIAEMINVLSAAGIEPKKDNLTQLSEAISKIVSGGIEGLGTAATHNVQTSPTDTTSGAVLMVSAFGLGGNSITVATTSNDDLHELPGIPFNAFREYKSSDGSVYLNGISAISSDGNMVEWLAPQNGADGTKVAVRNKTTLFTLYSDMNKPTANDIGALPSGGTAGAATKLATARKIAGHAFDGTVDISISAADVGALPTSYSPDLSAYITTSSANSKFLQGVQLGAKATQDIGGEGSVPAGCAVTGASTDNWDLQRLYYKPIQRNINGSWVTISG